MSRVVYGIIKEEYSCNKSRRVAYGIAAYADEAGEESACVLASARDLSDEQASVEKLVALCNREQLSIEHLQDIAEDYLASF